jgi:hypothetical protein
MDKPSPQLVPALVLSAVVALTAALGSLLYTETATVNLSVPPHRLQADLTINASPSGPDLSTTHIEAELTETQQGTASTTQVGGSNATGRVVFRCSPQCPTAQRVPQGTIVATASGVQFATQAAVTLTATGQAEVGVRAVQAGAAGNVAASTITIIVTNHASGLQVSNPSPTTGGVDGRTEQVILQSDLDVVSTALATKVTDDLNAALKAKSPGMTFVLDEPPILNVSSDHNVGDKVPTFNVTIIGSMSAAAFSEEGAQALLRSALEQKVPAGSELTSDPILTDYKIVRVSSRGNVTISGSAVGFIAPKISPATLAGQIRGMSVADARNHLQRTVPGSRVEIKTSPAAAYWLPLITKNIKLTVEVEPAQA